MILNHEQRQAILARIGNLEDDVYRCKMEMEARRGVQTEKEKAELTARIERQEKRIAQLKEGIND